MKLIGFLSRGRKTLKLQLVEPLCEVDVHKMYNLLHLLDSAHILL